ncbi:MAG: DUF1934 domain-containing protein [Eubacteriales bacterium]
MTREVLIAIAGTQIEETDSEVQDHEAIEIISPATYYFKDGIHYIFFEEVHEGIAGITRNKIVFKENEYLEVIKKGVTNSTMVFHCNETHVTNYETPFGEMQLGVITHKLHSKLEEHQLDIFAVYELAVDCEPYAECEIKLRIQDRSQGVI